MSQELLRALGYVGLFAFLLFLPSPNLHWPQAWILLVVLLAIRATGAVLLHRSSPELAIERRRLPLHQDQPMADRALLPLFMATFAALVAFNALDRWRLQLLLPPPFFVSIAGLGIFVGGWALVNHALLVNRFAVTVVRQQSERGHSVVDTGAYRYVRHPMYAGLVLVMVGMGLWLGSTAAAIGSVVPLGILVLRMTAEERVLLRDLPGYRDYRSRVRYRLFPGIW
jgi:protein-S-isoprenylcysteine O-methyltransferase Ste14